MLTRYISLKDTLFGFVDSSERSLEKLVKFAEVALPKFAVSAERNILNFAECAERNIQKFAKNCVPAINFAERIMLPPKQANLRTSSILHFNQQATCFSRDC